MSFCQDYMDKAFEKAEIALAQQEVPVGCVIVHKGQIISDGYNQTNKNNNVDDLMYFKSIYI